VPPGEEAGPPREEAGAEEAGLQERRPEQRRRACRSGGEFELPRRPSLSLSSSLRTPCRSAAVRSSLRPRRCSARRRRAPIAEERLSSCSSELCRLPHRHYLHCNNKLQVRRNYSIVSDHSFMLELLWCSDHSNANEVKLLSAYNLRAKIT
jgi:hypothetical protein